MAPRPRLAESALFLDVDGTLLGFQKSPEQVVADRELIEILRALQRGLQGALALVSGRTIAGLDRVFSPHRFAASGMHGAEYRLFGGPRIVAATCTVPASAVARCRMFAATVPGILVEEKTFGVALHYRESPQLETRCRDFLDRLVRELGEQYRGFAGNMVCELALSGNDKGTGLRSLLRSRVFAGRRPVFVGDDEPDEAGFRAVNALGGVSVRVGDANGTAARYGLKDVQAVRTWLIQALESLQR